MVVGPVHEAGHATLGLVLATAGIVVARRHLFASAGQTVLAGAAAGLLAAAMVAILPIAMSLINLRTIFVALNSPLYKFLTFSRPTLAEGVTALLLLGSEEWQPPARCWSNCQAGCAGR